MGSIMVLFGFLFLLVPAIYAKQFTKDLSPVILVPGDGGCQIEAKWKKPNTQEWLCVKDEPDWSVLWLSLEDFTPYIIACMADNIRLVYNTTTRTTHNSPGVETRIPYFGSTESLEYLDPYSPTHYFVSYFATVVSELLALGYERNVTLRGAPYDFRKAPNELGEYYEALTKLVESTWQARRRRVTLIMHSMGAPVIHYFLNRKSQAWKDKYIESIISLAGAWGGSVKPLKVYAVGDNLGYFFISAEAMKIAQKSLVSLAFLMPSLEIFDPKQVFVQTPTANYSLSNVEGYFKALNHSVGYEMYKDTYKLLYKAPPPGVQIHCLHGVGVPTIEKLIYPDEKSFPSYPTIVYGEGDGTVNNKSITSCLRWSSKQKQKIYHKTFDKVDHMGILRDPAVMDYIKKTLELTRLKNTVRRLISRWRRHRRMQTRHLNAIPRV